MTDTTLWLKRHGKSLTFTALFCFVIALGTQAICQARSATISSSALVTV